MNKQEIKQVQKELDKLIDCVGGDETHPDAEKMSELGDRISEHEDENIPELTAPAQDFALQVYDNIPELKDSRYPFVSVDLTFKTAECVELESHGLTLEELAQNIIEASDIKLESQILMTEGNAEFISACSTSVATQTQAGEYAYILSLKKMFNQLQNGKSDRIVHLKIQERSCTKIIVFDRADRQYFVKRLVKSLVD